MNVFSGKLDLTNGLTQMVQKIKLFTLNKLENNTQIRSWLVSAEHSKKDIRWILILVIFSKQNQNMFFSKSIEPYWKSLRQWFHIFRLQIYFANYSENKLQKDFLKTPKRPLLSLHYPKFYLKWLPEELRKFTNACPLGLLIKN